METINRNEKIVLDKRPGHEFYDVINGLFKGRSISKKPVKLESGSTTNLGSSGDIIFGVFYNSKDGFQHVAGYVPWRYTPYKSLCHRQDVNFSPTYSSDNICPVCKKTFDEMK